MPTLGFLIDNRKCIGCHACTVACKSEHEVPIGVDRTWVKYVEKGVFPNNRRLFTVMRCNHCDDAPCISICPVTSLYRRDDGVVDFNPDRCIGCKACMQACPYDALHIDPISNTAAKCNFCTHRLDAGLEPSCVVVCPTQAIVTGDLDNPNSKISQLIERHPVQVRKPEKGTRPKLVYIEADEASLVPSRTDADGQFMWSSGGLPQSGNSRDGQIAALPNQTTSQNLVADELSPGQREQPRRVYDVRPRPPAWNWAVVGYTWTKSVSAGSFLAAIAAQLFLGAAQSDAISITLGVIALVFLLITTALLVVDLKQPKRFLYVLLRPQWKSWLVRGAYFLTGYGAILSVWLVARVFAFYPTDQPFLLQRESWWTICNILMWPGVVLAVCSAVYTAFLFAQAKGRDFWQNPLLSVHLLSHALVAGGTVWLLAAAFFSASDSTSIARTITLVVLSFSLLTLIGELCTTPPTEDARRAMDMIVGRLYGKWFWGGGIVVGHVLPITILATNIITGTNIIPAGFAAILALGGMFVIERLWILAPQRISLS